MPTKKEMIEEAEAIHGKIPKTYVPETLTKSDLQKQLDSIIKGSLRPHLKSFKSRESKWTKKMREYFGEGSTSLEDLAKRLSKGNQDREKEILKGLQEIFEKGQGAYKSSGSRPNQTSFSWAFARVGSVLFNGPSRKIDKNIVEKYNLPSLLV